MVAGTDEIESVRRRNRKSISYVFITKERACTKALERDNGGLGLNRSNPHATDARNCQYSTHCTRTPPPDELRTSRVCAKHVGSICSSGSLRKSARLPSQV